MSWQCLKTLPFDQLMLQVVKVDSCKLNLFLYSFTYMGDDSLDECVRAYYRQDQPLCENLIKDQNVSSRIMVTGMVELGIGFLHILVSGVGIDKIHDLLALSIIYVMKD